jgi:hypothetical protein
MNRRFAASFLFVLASSGCDKAKDGEACRKTSQCVDTHLCMASACVERGSRHLIDITLVGTDHDDLACALDEPVAGLSCSHGSDQKQRIATPARESDTLLQPMTTKSGLTVLVAGLWSQPALAAKLDASRASSRFVAACSIKARGSVEKVRIRWKRSEGWLPATHLPVVQVESCKIGK